MLFSREIVSEISISLADNKLEVHIEIALNDIELTLHLKLTPI